MILPFLFGCEYVPLTDEQQAYVDDAYVSVGLEKDVVTALGAAADSIYGASTDGNTAFSADHEYSYTLLQRFYEENRIQGFDPADHPKFASSSAVLMRDVFGTPTYIGINIELYKYLISEQLIHEAGHSLQEGHDDSLVILFDEGLSIFSVDSKVSSE